MQPSVLTPVDLRPAVPLDGFESYSEGSSPSRRQRISMACQYCRHRKIRCCGGAPCRNCTRAQRECEYAPVPEEVNRATREKKAIAKAAKTISTPTTTYSPFFDNQAVYDHQYPRPGFYSHRRSVSTPNFALMPPAPIITSPAMFESNGWMYGNDYVTTTTPVMPQFPSVLEQTPIHAAYLASQSTPVTPPESRSGSAELEVPSSTTYIPTLPTSYSTPNMSSYLKPPVQIPTLISPPITPTMPTYYNSYTSPYQSPYHSPYPMYTPQMMPTTSSSPTLAPEMNKMVGLGINEVDIYSTPNLISEEYFTNPHY